MKCLDDDVNVTDHAVVRYLERVLEFPIADLRRQIADQCRAGVAMGACSVKVENHMYELVGNRVVTVMKRRFGAGIQTKQARIDGAGGNE